MPVHVRHMEPVAAWVELEDGGQVDLTLADRWVEPREVAGELVGEATVVVPPDLPLGWHTLCASVGTPAAEARTSAGGDAGPHAGTGHR